MLDQRIPDGLTQIRQGWTLDDLVRAHELLDELDVIAARERTEAEAKAKAQQQVRRR